MIYNESIILTEADADEFLESVGIELFENHVSIQGDTYSAIDGQSILKENGIILCENCIIIQERVTSWDYDSYKTYKYGPSMEEERKKEECRYYGRYGNEREKGDNIIDPQKNFYYPHDKNQHYGSDRTVDRSRVLKQPNLSPKYKKDYLDKHSDIDNKAHNALDREITRRNYQRSNDDNSIVDIPYSYRPMAADAKARHIRRHPKQYKESASIFSSIKFV